MVIEATKSWATLAPTTRTSSIPSSSTCRPGAPTPTGLTYVSASGTGWTCSESGGTVTCDYTGSGLAPGTSAPDFELEVRPRGADRFRNCATVPGDDDADDTNNEGCVTTTLQ